MFVIRLIVLVFLAFYSYSMGAERGPLNSFGHLVVYSGLVFIPALYMLPTFEAWLRKHQNLTSIALLNIFLGWTLLGWVAAIVWAFKKQDHHVMAKAEPAYAHVFQPKESRQTKACPYCAEEVLLAAVKCKHCGSEIPAT